uniref:Nudix hydrolase domain-containing protein n=1 Tax=Angiostrongylus cantonensis TaxID=6313 RepID=A0A0K0CZQ6_ANGCA
MITHQSLRMFGTACKQQFIKVNSSIRYRNIVLIPLLDINSTSSVLFTKRSIHLKNHRGEVCFPGGKMEDGESIEEAALRETQEEIGIDSSSVDVWGCLTPVLTRSLTSTVVPIVGSIPHQALKPENVNRNEVIFSVRRVNEHAVEKMNLHSLGVHSTVLFVHLSSVLLIM